MTHKLSAHNIAQKLTEITYWQVTNDSLWLQRKYKFKNWQQTLDFINKISIIAEDMNHHPNIEFSYGWCDIKIQTHDVSGLTELDFALAAKINQL